MIKEHENFHVRSYLKWAGRHQITKEVAAFGGINKQQLRNILRRSPRRTFDKLPLTDTTNVLTDTTNVLTEAANALTVTDQMLTD